MSGKRLTRATANQSGGNIIQPKKKLRKDSSENCDQSHLEAQQDDHEKNVGFSLVNYSHSIF